MEKKSGSITVFLTLIFVIFLSLITAFIENVRVISSEGYVTVAADSGIETAFGNYNKELYDNYKLFGYGGYNGMGIADFEEELDEILGINTAYKPEKSILKYSDLYKIRDVKCDVTDFGTLTQDYIFERQITDSITTGMAEGLLNTFKGKSTDEVKEDEYTSDSYDKASAYENGEYDTIEDDEGNVISSKPSDKEMEDSLKEDDAGGNPLKFIHKLINNGLLSLVCDVDKVSEDKVVKRELDYGDYLAEEAGMKEQSTGGFLRSLLKKDFGEMPSTDGLTGGSTKLKYLCYANQVFSSYTDKDFHTVHYGLEYLASGKSTEKDNLASVVKKLLVVRTALNLAYLVTSPRFEKKSFATAMALVGFTGIAPVIEGVKYTILTVLAFEEACVDVTALLDHRKVPMIKTDANFKMKYHEICMVSRHFFEKKAKQYKKADKNVFSADISYDQYLCMLMLLVPQEKLKARMLDIIQYDLRKRFNQSFEIDDCICNVNCDVSYHIPFVYSYVKKSLFRKNGDTLQRNINVKYGYVPYKI